MKYLYLTSLFLLAIAGCSANNQNAVADNQTIESDTQITTFQNDFFKVDIPSNWEIFSSEGPHMPSHVSLVRKDGSALITLGVARSSRTIEDTCNLVANNLVNDSKNLLEKPEVQFGTCIVQAKENGIHKEMWMRSYEDKSLYSIYFEGELSIVDEILSSLQGNEEMMSLLVRPI